MVNPPKPGDASFEQFSKERTAELASLRRRAHMVTDSFNALEGVTCNFTEGAMYSFPRVRHFLCPYCAAICYICDLFSFLSCHYHMLVSPGPPSSQGH